MAQQMFAVHFVHNHVGTKLMLDGILGEDAAVIQVWNTEPPLAVLFKINRMSCQHVCFSGDDRLIIGYCCDGRIYEWDANTGTEIISFEAIACALAHGYDNGSLICSLDGNACAVFAGSIISVSELNSGRELLRQISDVDIAAACFGVNDASITVAYYATDKRPGHVNCWSLQGNELLFSSAAVDSRLVFCPSSAMYYTVDSRKRVVQAFDGRSGEEVSRNNLPVTGYNVVLYCCQHANIFL
jgi:WD40 repeat protein